MKTQRMPICQKIKWFTRFKFLTIWTLNPMFQQRNWGWAELVSEIGYSFKLQMDTHQSHCHHMSPLFPFTETYWCAHGFQEIAALVSRDDVMPSRKAHRYLQVVLLPLQPLERGLPMFLNDHYSPSQWFRVSIPTKKTEGLQDSSDGSINSSCLLGIWPCGSDQTVLVTITPGRHPVLNGSSVM